MDLFTVEQTIGTAAESVTSFWAVLKWVYFLAFGLYVMFAVVVLSQVKQMMMALSGGFDRGLRFIVWGHLGLAVFALILAIVVLW